MKSETKTLTLSEYLVTEYNVSSTRLGSYTLYGEYDKVLERANQNKKDKSNTVLLDYKGETEFETDWMVQLFGHK